MDISISIVSVFALALTAPWICRVARGATGVLLALLVLALTAYFSSFVPDVASGQIASIGFVWVPSLNIQLSFYLDGLSLLFALLITFVGALVLIYSGAYLNGDPRLGRFYLLLLLFMGSMLGLVLANNIVVLFVFWELTSLSSYFLIGFEHEREGARAAALQALLVTSGGGLALLAGFLLLGHAAGTFELTEIVGRAQALRAQPLVWPILVLILLGAFTKSAQFPFHFWLPNAMEAPTPVSAYLHSATMVKAGIYLLARLSPVFGGTALWHAIVTPVGGITMIAAALMAFGERDLKRILAYSTVSALGVMTFMLGVGTGHAAAAMVIFLLGHAFYKGALFLVAGTVDHEAGTRDVSRLGGLASAMPLTATAACLAGLSMAGMVPFFGFIGKEAIYEALLTLGSSVILLLAAILTNVLFFALACIAVIQPFFGQKRSSGKPHEAPWGLWLGPLVLGALGLGLSFLPASLEQALVSSSAAATLGRSTSVDVEVWHGFTPALLLSILTFAGGAGVYALRSKVAFGSHVFDKLGNFGPEGGYTFFITALNWVARTLTRRLQSGYLRYYLLIVIITLLVLIGSKLGKQIELIKLVPFDNPRFYEWGVAVLILAAALAVVRAESRLTAIAALGVVGYSVALVYVLFGAPDLAMTQFMIETLSVILFVLVFYHLPRSAPLSSAGDRVRDAIVACAGGAVITVLVLLTTQISLYPKISAYFAEHSLNAAHGRNIVNVILVDFRGFDTLGEITVLALAGIGIFALLKLRVGQSGKK